MPDGFLGYHASFMMDVVVCALTVVIPTLAYSLYAVKFRKQYTRHRNLQVLLGCVLLATVVLFEVDLRLQGMIDGLLSRRPVPLTAEQLHWFRSVLRMHLVFSISTVGLWTVTLILALRHMPRPPAPCRHSAVHKVLGWASAIDMALTSATGLMVYYYGFVV